VREVAKVDRGFGGMLLGWFVIWDARKRRRVWVEPRKADRVGHRRFRAD